MFPENDIIFTSVWPWILIAVSVGLTVLEALMKKRAIFALVSAVFTAASAVVLLILGGSLCDMLLLLDCLHALCSEFPNGRTHDS